LTFGCETESGGGVESSVSIRCDFGSVDRVLNTVQLESDGGRLGVDRSDSALGDIIALRGGHSFVSDKLISALEGFSDA